MANSQVDENAFARPRNSTWIVLRLFVCRAWFLLVVTWKGTVSCFYRTDRFRVLGASLSSFGCFVFEIWVLRFRDLGASCFSLRFRVLPFRNYHVSPQGAHTVCLCNGLHCYFIVNVLDLPSSSSVAAYLQSVYGSMLTKRCVSFR